MELSELIGQRHELKAQELKYQGERRKVEKLIRETPEFQESVTAKPIGKRDFFGASFTVSEKREWDQGALRYLATVIPPELFPFRMEYKEDRRASSRLAEERPELWAELRKALTVKHSSPTFGE